MGKIIRGKPLLENLFGENNTLKVLNFLLMGREFDFTLTQLKSGTGLSRTAIRNAIEKLEDKEVVVKTREDEKSKYYKINTKGTKYKLLKQLYDKLQKEVLAS